jgi:hypothetical protein
MAHNLEALLRCLPATDLEAAILGVVSGWQPTDAHLQPVSAILWMEPPAGGRVPYVDPVQATALLLQHQGQEPTRARDLALAQFAALRPQLAVAQRVRYLDDFDPDSPEHIPGDLWLVHLRAQACVPQHVLDFLSRTLQACSEVAAFNHPGAPGQRLSLQALPSQPPANSLIQFQPGCPWGAEEGERAGIAGGCPQPDWMTWRNLALGYAAAIEARWGVSPLHLADPDDEMDDDLIHRLLVLHWCCTCKPESAYVNFLLEASGAESVEALKAALLAPENYSQPYALRNEFGRMEPGVSHFQYVAPTQKVPYVSVVFEHLSCLPALKNLLLQQVGTDVLLIDVNNLLPEEALEDSARHARHVMRQMGWRDPLDDVLEVLAGTDVLHVLEGPNGSRECPDVSAAVMFLIGLADVFRVKTHFHLNQGGTLWSFMDLPVFQAMASRARTWLESQSPHLNAMEEIHVACDFAATGLWDKRGAMLAYDTQVLPWDLIRRLSAWQWDYDVTFNPPEHMGTDAWWSQHAAQRLVLAKEVQRAVGPQVRVMVDTEGGPVWVGDLENGEA